MSMARSSSKMIRIWIRSSGLKNLFKDSTLLRDRTKIVHQSTSQLQTCIVMKACIMITHVHHVAMEGLSSLIALFLIGYNVYQGITFENFRRVTNHSPKMTISA